MRVIGIDLGTTNSAVAVMNSHGQPEILPNREGEDLTPSVVCFEADGTRVVGSSAKNLSIVDPQNVVQFVKRQMGNRDWRFITENGEELSPEEISATILRRLKEDAEAALGEPVTHAVITVPAYFQDAERTATVDAGKMAGLTVARIINEPTAAALAYGLGNAADEKVVVYDLGGGTFDVTVLAVQPSGVAVLAHHGDRNLGGLDWDNALILHLEEQFKSATGISLLDDPRTEQELREKAEKAKITLSQLTTVKVVLSAEGRHETVALERSVFEDLTQSLLDRTQVLLDDAIYDAGLTWDDIDKVLLVGGSTKMPAVVRLVENATGKTPSRELHPDQVVALGAAIQGAICAGEIEEREGPVSPETRQILDQAGLVEISVTDATAHSLGLIIIDLDRGIPVNDVVVDRGTALPADVQRVYTTVQQAQSAWNVQVTQGEERDPNLVKVIGTGSIPFDGPRPLGHPMRVSFVYDADSLIHVHAWDGASNVYWGEVTIERASNLDHAEFAAGAARVAAAEVT